METNKKKQGFSVRLINSVRFKFVIIVIILLLTAILCLSIPLSIALQNRIRIFWRMVCFCGQKFFWIIWN